MPVSYMEIDLRAFRHNLRVIRSHLKKCTGACCNQSKCLWTWGGRVPACSFRGRLRRCCGSPSGRRLCC